MKVFQVYLLIGVLIAHALAENQFVKINVDQSVFKRAFSPTPRISNGDTAAESDFPWHALLVIKGQDVTTNETYCGGAILNEFWIISTAECLKNAKTVRIDVGSTNVSLPYRSVYPDAYTIHPEFDEAVLGNNLALLRLSGVNALHFPSEASPRFAPIRLPQKRQQKENFEGFEAYFSGFGQTTFNGKNISEFLQYTEQRVISNAACAGFYDNDLKLITPKVICSSSVDMHQGACPSDIGGPLVINEYGTYTLIGVMSFIHPTGNCGRQPVPTVFTRITSQFDWIAKVTRYQFRQ